MWRQRITSVSSAPAPSLFYFFKSASAVFQSLAEVVRSVYRRDEGTTGDDGRYQEQNERSGDSGVCVETARRCSVRNDNSGICPLLYTEVCAALSPSTPQTKRS